MTPELLRGFIEFLESIHGPTEATVRLIQDKKAQLAELEREAAA